MFQKCIHGHAPLSARLQKPRVTMCTWISLESQKYLLGYPIYTMRSQVIKLPSSPVG